MRARQAPAEAGGHGQQEPLASHSAIGCSSEVTPNVRTGCCWALDHHPLPALQEAQRSRPATTPRSGPAGQGLIQARRWRAGEQTRGGWPSARGGAHQALRGFEQTRFRAFITAEISIIDHQVRPQQQRKHSSCPPGLVEGGFKPGWKVGVAGRPRRAEFLRQEKCYWILMRE